MELIKTFKLSEMSNNAYLIKLKNKYILIDAPQEIEKVISFLEKKNINLAEVWLTHAHIDHILGLNDLQEKYPQLQVYLADEEIPHLNNLTDNLGENFNFNFSFLGEAQKNEILTKEYPELEIKYISGHSLKSSVYIFAKEQTIFSGDTLFYQSIGRSDLIHGNQEKLIKGIKEHLFILPREYHVYPGHGSHTTIGFEIEENKVIGKIN